MNCPAAIGTGGTTPEPENILPTSCLVTVLNWGMGIQIREV
jgi:hypothetical protein